MAQQLYWMFIEWFIVMMELGSKNFIAHVYSKMHIEQWTNISLISSLWMIMLKNYIVLECYKYLSGRRAFMCMPHFAVWWFIKSVYDSTCHSSGNYIGILGVIQNCCFESQTRGICPLCPLDPILVFQSSLLVPSLLVPSIRCSY